jgi:hypothetical protein
MNADLCPGRSAAWSEAQRCAADPGPRPISGLPEIGNQLMRKSAKADLRARPRISAAPPRALRAPLQRIRGTETYLLHTASRLDARMIDHLFCPLVITL